MEKGLIVENGRIFRQTARPEIILPTIDNFHRGSDPAYTKDGDLVVLTGNTLRYDHGIFGNRENATGFAVLKNGRIIVRYELEGKFVFETLRPTVVDLIPENRGEEIVLTVSDNISGSKISVFSLDGILLGSSDAIGRGYRWLHLLAIAEFGLDGTMRVSVVRTPHIGGILQYYEWQNNKLEMVASMGNISTHQNGSDNQNMAIAADFDGIDGAKLLLPTNNYSELVIVKFENRNIKIINRFKLPGRLNTNIYFDEETPLFYLGGNRKWILCKYNWSIGNF